MVLAQLPVACGILVPLAGIEPVSAGWEGDFSPLDLQGSPSSAVSNTVLVLVEWPVGLFLSSGLPQTQHTCDASTLENPPTSGNICTALLLSQPCF